MNPFKATGPSGLSNARLTHCADLLTPYLGCLYCTTFQLNTFPQQWKTTTTAILRKPNKPDYTVAKAYRPITLMETLAKPLWMCCGAPITPGRKAQPSPKHQLWWLPGQEHHQHPSLNNQIHLRPLEKRKCCVSLILRYQRGIP